MKREKNHNREGSSASASTSESPFYNPNISLTEQEEEAYSGWTRKNKLEQKWFASIINEDNCVAKCATCKAAMVKEKPYKYVWAPPLPICRGPPDILCALRSCIGKKPLHSNL